MKAVDDGKAQRSVMSKLRTVGRARRKAVG